IKPPQQVNPDVMADLLMATDNSFDEFIREGNLEKAPQLANAVPRSVSRENLLDLQERTEVINSIIGKIESSEVKAIVELLQSSSVIGSAPQALDTAFPESLVN
ncbi:hypothetical protein AWC38_SpisGene24090, partial [Stylophora pistillata]